MQWLQDALPAFFGPSQVREWVTWLSSHTVPQRLVRSAGC